MKLSWNSQSATKLQHYLFSCILFFFFAERNFEPIQSHCNQFSIIIIDVSVLSSLPTDAFAFCIVYCALHIVHSVLGSSMLSRCSLSLFLSLSMKRTSNRIDQMSTRQKVNLHNYALKICTKINAHKNTFHSISYRFLVNRTTRRFNEVQALNMSMRIFIFRFRIPKILAPNIQNWIVQHNQIDVKWSKEIALRCSLKLI